MFLPNILYKKYNESLYDEEKKNLNYFKNINEKGDWKWIYICPYCGKEIDTDIGVCPKCGCPKLFFNEKHISINNYLLHRELFNFNDCNGNLYFSADPYFDSTRMDENVINVYDNLLLNNALGYYTARSLQRKDYDNWFVISYFIREDEYGNREFFIELIEYRQVFKSYYEFERRSYVLNKRELISLIMFAKTYLYCPHKLMQSLSNNNRKVIFITREIAQFDSLHIQLSYDYIDKYCIDFIDEVDTKSDDPLSYQYFFDEKQFASFLKHILCIMKITIDSEYEF